MGEGDRALGHKRGSDRDIELFGEGHHCLGSAGADHAVARHDHGKTRVGNDLDCLVDFALGRHRWAGALHFERRFLLLQRRVRNVLRKRDKAAAGFFRLRVLKRLADDFGDDFGFQDLDAVFRDRIE